MNATAFTVSPTQHADLRATFLHVFDSFASDPVHIADQVPSVNNSRHGRELLAVLTQAGLVQDEMVNGDDQQWQVVNPGTYDDSTREEAEAVFDATFTPSEGDSTPAPPSATKPTPKAQAKPAKDTNPADLPFCKCGCGANVGRKSYFKPGHDARMAGDVARSIAADSDDRDALLDTLPSDALRAKASDMADRLISKKESAANKADAKIAAKAEATSTPAPPSATPTQAADPMQPAPKPTEDSVPVKKSRAKRASKNTEAVASLLP